MYDKRKPSTPLFTPHIMNQVSLLLDSYEEGRGDNGKIEAISTIV